MKPAYLLGCGLRLFCQIDFGAYETATLQGVSDQVYPPMLFVMWFL
jgi:hypothetical protein